METEFDDENFVYEPFRVLLVGFHYTGSRVRTVVSRFCQVRSDSGDGHHTWTTHSVLTLFFVYDTS